MAKNVLKGKCANFQTLLLAFVALGIIAAAAAVVSFAMMCRHRLNHVPSADTSIKICKAVYRPGDNTVALAEVFRMVLAFVAFVTVFIFCGVCCCYRLSVARDQKNHLKGLLASYDLGIGTSKDFDKEFKLYLAEAMDSQATDSQISLQDKEVKISLISVPDEVELAAREEDEASGSAVGLLSEHAELQIPADLEAATYEPVAS